MTRILQAALASVGLVFGIAASAATPTIELRDGSRVQGDIQSIDHGVYTVVSRSMGTLHIQQSDVARIVYGGGQRDDGDTGTGHSAQNSQLAAQSKQLESKLVQDPEMMKSILDLQSDPQIQALLADPAIIQAIQNGDYTSLLGNPKIQALENNAKLSALLKQLQ